MLGERINEQTILDELHKVPQERWDLVLDFIRCLRLRPEQPSDKKRPMTAADLLQSGLVGLWADRTDLGDSREFARRLREQAQTRRPSE